MKVEPSILHDWSLWIATAAVSAITGLCGVIWWIGRIIFTNNRRIDLLEKEHKHARELRENQDGAIQEIRADQKKLIEHLLKSK